MRAPLIALSLVALSASHLAGQEKAGDPLAAALQRLLPHVLPEADRPDQRTMLSRLLRERIQAANRQSTADWNALDSRAAWERFRAEKLAALRAALGPLPPRPASPRIRQTREIAGDGFVIHNLVYESRPGLVVTANLYVPRPLRPSMPGLLVSHSHHNPKEQGELQDMGMTWARAGCYVLVPDHLGHGERRQHPFAAAADFEQPFQAGRQDYYFRYDTSLQLYLAGHTLMGWMVHDLMTGVDVLLAQPGIDRERLILLGAVAGGGDPAAVTAALDERIACAVPFNFGGPQPETRYPLPDDAETSFHYAGSGSWESTRNLARSAAEGFLPWAIVASIAPRRLIHAHEFAWDRDRDPVWKRYQKIWAWYDAADRLAFAHGHGGLTTTDPPGSHCNNIGAVHRRQIHDAFRRLFQIEVRPEDEYSRRLPPEDLRCLTPAVRTELGARPLHELLAAEADERLQALRAQDADLPLEQRRRKVRQRWTALLGDTSPPPSLTVVPGVPHVEQLGPLTVRREVLISEPGVRVPVLTLARTAAGGQPRPGRMLIVGLASDGIAAALARRQDALAMALGSELFEIALVEVRGTGASSPGDDRGQQGAITAHSATQLMLGPPLLAGQLRDLRTAWRHLRARPGLAPEAAIVGGSGVSPLPSEPRFRYPRRIGQRPPEIQPTAALLALLLALYEDDVAAADARHGLVSYRAVLGSPFVQVPHEAIVPGVLRQGDLPDLVAALAPREVTLESLADGQGQAVEEAEALEIYAVARRAYEQARAATSLNITPSRRP